MTNPLARIVVIASVCAPLAAFLIGCPPVGVVPQDSGTSGSDTAVGPGDSGPAAVCGNGALEGGEQCDGANLGGSDCMNIGQGFVGGTLACAGNCTLNTGGCVAPAGCGDGVIAGSEQCDGGNLAGATCASIAQGFVGGTLACSGGCLYDTTGCNYCGNGMFDSLTEECDGTAFGGATCASLGMGGGTLACTSTCDFDTSGCGATSGCGNGILEAGEACDGASFGGMTCEDFGLTSGSLTCSATCTITRTSCIGPDLMVLADGLDGTAPSTDLFITMGYNLNSCEVATCNAGGTTGRRILEFTLVSENIGNATLHFGSPTAILPPYTGLWTYAGAACGYYQFNDYATFWLCPSSVADCANAPASMHSADGAKGSFCFIENYGDAPDWTGAPASCGMYDCGDMGQQPGCADDYFTGLDCQWIDITGLASGSYTMCAWIDPTNVVYELNDNNNISCVTVSI
jgi:hypothetical protein